MWQKGQAERIKKYIPWEPNIRLPTLQRSNHEKKNCITESDFTGTEEYLNQMYSLLFTKYKQA